MAILSGSKKDPRLPVLEIANDEPEELRRGLRNLLEDRLAEKELPDEVDLRWVTSDGYLIGEQRKQINDLINFARTMSQAKLLAVKYDVKLLLLSGITKVDHDYKIGSFSYQSGYDNIQVANFLLTLQSMGIKIVESRTDNPELEARLIVAQIAYWNETERKSIFSSPDIKLISINQDLERALGILMKFQGIGLDRARKLIRRYKSLDPILFSEPKDIAMDGIGIKTTKTFQYLLKKQFTEEEIELFFEEAKWQPR